MRFKELIAKTDELAVKQYLLRRESSPLDQEYYSIIGFLYGLAMTPEHPEDDDWLSSIVGEDAAREHTDPVIESLDRIYKEYVVAFDQGRLGFPFNLSHMLENNGAMEPLINWVSGLTDAFYFRSSFWDSDAFSGLETDRRELLYHSMLMLEGIVDSAIVKEVFEKLPPEVLHQVYPTLDLSNDTVDRQITMICIMSCQEAVEALQQYVRDIQEMRGSQPETLEKKAGEMIQVDFSDKNKKE